MNFVENESAQKLRGGYYTPEDLATFIARWISKSAPRHVLEPSCGDGVFVKAFHNVGYTKKLNFTHRKTFLILNQRLIFHSGKKILRQL